MMRGWGWKVKKIRRGEELKKLWEKGKEENEVIIEDYNMIKEKGIEMIGFERERLKKEIKEIMINEER